MWRQIIITIYSVVLLVTTWIESVRCDNDTTNLLRGGNNDTTLDDVSSYMMFVMFFLEYTER